MLTIATKQVVLMAGMNSVSHGSQDLFPTFLADQARRDDTMVTVITVVGQLGALIGSTLIGYCSSFTGESSVNCARRRIRSVIQPLTTSS